MEDVLYDKYHFSRDDSRELTDFLTRMLDVYPNKRADAGASSNHPWLVDTPYMTNTGVDVPYSSTGEGILGWSKEMRK